MNQEDKMECNICASPINDKVWICMEPCCNKNTDDESVLSRPENLCVLICENHIGANQLSQNTSMSHKIVCMYKGKVQNSSTGSANMWVPKNLFKNHSHLIEKRLFLQKQIMNKVNNEDFARLAINKWKKGSKKSSDKGSIFDNVHLLDDISADCNSENNNDIDSMYKHPAPGYEHLNIIHDSLAAINFEVEENSSIYNYTDGGDYSYKSVLPDDEKEEQESCEDLDLNSVEEDQGEYDSEECLSEDDFELELIDK